MRKYLVRMSCEYSMVVEAESAHEAVLAVEDVPVEEWISCWSPLEAEEYGET